MSGIGVIGAVEVKDGSSCTGPRMKVRVDGSLDANVLNDPMNVNVTNASVGVDVTPPLAASAPTVHKVVPTASTQLLDQNDDRLSFMVANRGATEIILGIGETADLAEGFPVAPGGVYVSPAGVRFAGKVNVISAVGGENVRVTEYLS